MISDDTTTNSEIDRINKINSDKISPLEATRELNRLDDYIKKADIYHVTAHAIKDQSIDENKLDELTKNGSIELDKYVAALEKYCASTDKTKSVPPVFSAVYNADFEMDKVLFTLSIEHENIKNRIINAISDGMKKTRLMSDMVNKPDNEICNRKDTIVKSSVDYKNYFSLYGTALKDEISKENTIYNNLDKLINIWSEKRNELEQKISELSKPAQSEMIKLLPYIIGTYLFFGLALFYITSRFKEESQLELITSGQLIQFATVMVLLIVIYTLGMSSVLTENTLGTLLGGIGGYVLAQGVGRTARLKEPKIDNSVNSAPPVTPNP